MFSVKSDHGGFSYVRTIGYQQSFQIIDDAVLGEIMFRRGLDYIFDTFWNINLESTARKCVKLCML